MTSQEAEAKAMCLLVLHERAFLRPQTFQAHHPQTRVLAFLLPLNTALLAQH
jgi:hypothetical protein